MRGAQNLTAGQRKFSSTFFKRWQGFGDRVPEVEAQRKKQVPQERSKKRAALTEKGAVHRVRRPASVRARKPERRQSCRSRDSVELGNQRFPNSQRAAGRL